MSLTVAPEVQELLSDAQIEAVEVQVRTGRAPCLRCGGAIDPSLGDAAVILIVDPSPRRAAVRVSHEGCGPSVVAEAALPGPAEARLAERWASFVLPAVPLVVLQSDAAVWADEHGPALTAMLRGLGFEDAREAFDSDLFASGVGAPPRGRGIGLVALGADLGLRLADGQEIEALPGVLTGVWAELARSRAGALVAIGPTLGLPEEGGIGFDELLPVLLDRTVAAWLPLTSDPQAQS